jgi:hypothetical protein|tara:strand:+ start:998 stop:1219 length:222 start_codon:yes stop_codon:yes gene_type:complete
MADYIAKKDLKKGAHYICDARTFYVGRWNGEKFLYIGTHYNTYVMDEALYWDDHPKYGTVKPLKEIKEPYYGK